MRKKCNVCGSEVLIAKIHAEKNKLIKCPYCYSIALLKIKKRNGRVKGLKSCFLRTKYFII